MNLCIMKAALFSAGALLVAGAALGSAPSSSQSTKPTGIQLVGSNNSSGSPTPDPRGNATWIIRDAVPNVIPNAQVQLDFSHCPQITLCDQVSPNFVVNCAAKTVTGMTDGTGAVTFSIVGTVEQTNYFVNQDFPEPDPPPPPPGSQNYLGCCRVTVTVPGFPPVVYPNVIAAAYDHEVQAPGVGAGDLAHALADLLSGNYRERTDYDVSIAAGGAGVLNSADLSQSIATVLGGGSFISCGQLGVGTPCPSAPAPSYDVEIDWFEKAGAGAHNHKPAICELEAIKAAFARKGIAWNYTLGNAIDETAALSVIDFTAPNPFDQPTGEWHDLEVANRNSPSKHYMVFAHNYSVNGTFTTSSGLAELPGDECVVTLGSFANQVGTSWDRAGTAMHEFGHDLGLHHSGGQDESTVQQYKPNYASVMAYRYQLLGVKSGLLCQGLSTVPNAAAFFNLDYSSGTLANLDENALVECAGLGLGAQVDWDCSGGIAPCNTTVAKDVSSPGSGGHGEDWCGATLNQRSLISDYNDWANIQGGMLTKNLAPTFVSCMTPQEARLIVNATNCTTQPDPCAAPEPLLPLVPELGDLAPGSRLGDALGAGPRGSLELVGAGPGVGPDAVRFTMGARGGVATVGVYDVGGRLRRNLFQGDLPEKAVRVLSWGGVDDAGQRLPPGVYFVRLTAPNLQTSRTVVLLP